MTLQLLKHLLNLWDILALELWSPGLKHSPAHAREQRLQLVMPALQEATG